MMNKKSTFFFIFIVLFSLASPAMAKRRYLNYRMMKKKSADTTQNEVAVSSNTKNRAKILLMKGRWSPEVKTAIENMIFANGRGSENYNEKKPPVAVLPWSDAVVSGDPAELVFLSQVSQVNFHFDDSWWGIIPIVYGRQVTRAAYTQFISLSSSVWTSQPSYSAWRKGMISGYLQLCAGVGRKECRSYLARLWSGWYGDDAVEYAREVLKTESQFPGSFEMVPGEPDDRSPLRARRGMRVIPEMRDLISKLLSSGFDVWVIDDVSQPILEAAASSYGIDESRIYGIHNSTDGARLGADILKPVPTRGGKTEIVQSSLGRPADFVFGRDIADVDLLQFGEGLRVILDIDPELVKKAKERGWMIQHSFVR